MHGGPFAGSAPLQTSQIPILQTSARTNRTSLPPSVQNFLESWIIPVLDDAKSLNEGGSYGTFEIYCQTHMIELYWHSVWPVSDLETLCQPCWNSKALFWHFLISKALFQLCVHSQAMFESRFKSKAPFELCEDSAWTLKLCFSFAWPPKLCFNNVSTLKLWLNSVWTLFEL